MSQRSLIRVWVEVLVAVGQKARFVWGNGRGKSVGWRVLDRRECIVRYGAGACRYLKSIESELVRGSSSECYSFREDVVV